MVFAAMLADEQQSTFVQLSAKIGLTESWSAFVVTFIIINSTCLRLPDLKLKNTSTAASRQRWLQA